MQIATIKFTQTVGLTPEIRAKGQMTVLVTVSNKCATNISDLSTR
jgi:hypothetical protein